MGVAEQGHTRGVSAVLLQGFGQGELEFGVAVDAILETMVRWTRRHE